MLQWLAWTLTVGLRFGTVRGGGRERGLGAGGCYSRLMIELSLHPKFQPTWCIGTCLKVCGGWWWWLETHVSVPLGIKTRRLDLGSDMRIVASTASTLVEPK
jgi:hypothetical protein